MAPGGAIAFTNGTPLSAYLAKGQFQAPILSTVDYYFAPVISPGSDIIYYGSPPPEAQPYPLPLNDDFAVTNQTPLMTGVVGQPMTIAGWAKQAIVNGNPNKFGYLGQYFEKAFLVDTNGVVTTNQAGTLSPYGEFLPIQPGPAALVTMTNWGGGDPGTGIVHVSPYPPTPTTMARSTRASLARTTLPGTTPSASGSTTARTPVTMRATAYLDKQSPQRSGLSGERQTGPD